jgi:chemotaxis response regulator CheB
MPGAAVQTGSVDFVLPLEEIPNALITLVIKGDVG